MGPEHFWWGGGRQTFKQDSKTALDILKKRDAKRELKKEEFEQMKKGLAG